MIRENDHLVLLPFCQEFNTMKGFHLPELAGQSVHRWTQGSEQRIYWKSPKTPGQYLIRFHFWRPQPYPRSQMMIEYRFNPDQPLKSMTVEKGSVIIEETIDISVPLEPMSLEMYTDCWIENNGMILLLIKEIWALCFYGWK